MIEGYTAARRKTRFSCSNECIEIRLDESTSKASDSSVGTTGSVFIPIKDVQVPSVQQSPHCYSEGRDALDDYLRMCSEDQRDSSLEDFYPFREESDDGYEVNNATAIVNMAEVEKSLGKLVKPYQMYLSNVTDVTIPSTTRAVSTDEKRDSSVSELACLRLYAESQRRKKLRKKSDDVIHRHLRLSNEITAKAFAFAKENWSNRLYQQAKERSARLAAKALIAFDAPCRVPFIGAKNATKKIQWNTTASTFSDTTCDYDYDLDESRKRQRLALAPTPEVCERLYNLGKQRLLEKKKDNVLISNGANSNDNVSSGASRKDSKKHNAFPRDESIETVYQRLYRLAQEQRAQKEKESVEKGTRLHRILTARETEEVCSRLYENDKVQDLNNEGRR